MEVRPFMKDIYIMKGVAPVAAQAFERIEDHSRR
jgi:hypothetical protein